jgi:hypothetical protein
MVLKHYMADGTVVLLPWSLPVESQKDIRLVFVIYSEQFRDSAAFYGVSHLRLVLNYYIANGSVVQLI